MEVALGIFRSPAQKFAKNENRFCDFPATLVRHGHCAASFSGFKSPVLAKSLI